MKPSLTRNVYLYSRSLLMPNPCLATTSFWSNHRLFSSKSPNQPLTGSNSGHTRDNNDDSLHDEDDISNKALKRQIDRFFEGDEEAFPSIFEAVLKRKLAGKSEESDEELMNELQAQSRQHAAADKGSDSD